MHLLMDPTFWGFAAFMFFMGLCFGWFFKRFNVFLIIIGLVIFYPILELLELANHWAVTLPFLLGFLVHTYKPLMQKIRGY